MSSIGTDGLIDLDKLRTDMESQGGSVIGTTFPVTVTKGNVTYQVDQYGNITEPSVIPQISYTVINTDGSEITGTSNSELPEMAKLNITITNIKELTVTSIKVKDPSGKEIIGGEIDLAKGTAGVEITENGKYIIEIEATDKNGKNASGSSEATVNGKIKIANLEDNWVLADSSNSGNDWYAYTDNTGKIAKVNQPKLTDGMKAIKYETETGELVNGSKWANAMTKDGSMWVWIPRYAYKITSGYHQSGSDINPTDGKLGAGTIEIAFLKENTNEFIDKNITGTVVSGSDVTDATYTDDTKWILAPGFTFGTEEDKEITGFWFAKFEASPVGATSTLEAQSIAEENISTTIVQVKPNQYSWRNITSANIFSYCLNLKNMKSSDELVYFNNVNNVDTHMTKNVEWGAVAYLTHSKYGLNGEEICINTNGSYLTGYGIGDTISTSGNGSQYNTTTGIKSSTTKNVYGIYDMSGCAWEYVATCYNSSEGIAKLISDTNNANNMDYVNKYIDVYSSYNNSKYGDAIFETSSNTNSPYTNSWFSDYSNFVNSYDPVFSRGGGFGIGSSNGLFYFGYGSGNTYIDCGFRPVCVVK